MTRGTPHVAATEHPNLRRATTRQTRRILELLQTGETLDRIAERGVLEGWTRARVVQVVREQGWQLDAAGRLPTPLDGVPAADVIRTALNHPHPAVRAAGQRAAHVVDGLRRILTAHGNGEQP